MTKIIGLTGGIGSGKTTVANFFKTKGIPVYIADEEAKRILATDGVLAKIKETFGEDFFTNQQLDRSKLANFVFKDKEALKKLNQIIHPEVKKDFLKWVKHHSNYPFVVKEAAILFESGSYKDCDQIILVTAPLELRIERVIKRDNATREAILDRIKNQWTEEEKILKSNYVIHNISLKKALSDADNILKILNNM